MGACGAVTEACEDLPECADEPESELGAQVNPIVQREKHGKVCVVSYARDMEIPSYDGSVQRERKTLFYARYEMKSCRSCNSYDIGGPKLPLGKDPESKKTLPYHFYHQFHAEEGKGRTCKCSVGDEDEELVANWFVANRQIGETCSPWACFQRYVRYVEDAYLEGPGKSSLSVMTTSDAANSFDVSRDHWTKDCFAPGEQSEAQAAAQAALEPDTVFAAKRKAGVVAILPVQSLGAAPEGEPGVEDERATSESSGSAVRAPPPRRPVQDLSMGMAKWKCDVADMFCHAESEVVPLDARACVIATGDGTVKEVLENTRSCEVSSDWSLCQLRRVPPCVLDGPTCCAGETGGHATDQALEDCTSVCAGGCRGE